VENQKQAVPYDEEDISVRADRAVIEIAKRTAEGFTLII